MKNKSKNKKSAGIRVKITKKNHYAEIQPIEKIKTKKFLTLGKDLQPKIEPKKMETSKIVKKVKTEEIKPAELKAKSSLSIDKPREVMTPTKEKIEIKREMVHPLSESKPKQILEPKKELVEKSPEEIRKEEEKKSLIQELQKFPVDMIETEIDKLMDLIEKKKSVSIGELSQELKVSIEQIENWAKILEENNMIEIEYPIIGLPKLRKKEWKEELEKEV